MFEGQPKGLYALALANTGERFGYYTMLAIFTLFLQAKFGFTAGEASNIYGGFLAAVYFIPLLGGILADRFGYGFRVFVAGRSDGERCCENSHVYCTRIDFVRYGFI